MSRHLSFPPFRNRSELQTLCAEILVSMCQYLKYKHVCNYKLYKYGGSSVCVCVCGRINKSYGNGSALQAPESGGKWKRGGVKGAWSGRKAARPKAIYMQFSHIFFPYSRFFLLHRKPARSKRLPLKDNITFCPPFVFYILLHLATINGFLTKTWKSSKNLWTKVNFYVAHYKRW